MKKAITIICLMLLGWNTFGQKKADHEKIQPIIEEGKRLYQLEMASWHGTDIFREHYEQMENVGGYFSYTDGKQVKCIFFSKAEKPIVIGTVAFDETYNTSTADLSLTERNFTKKENSIFTIRQKALITVQEDSLFKLYENTTLNLIPIIYNGLKKVYVVTVPQQSGVVIFGNDYLISFDKKGVITSTQELHEDIMPIDYNTTDDGKMIVSSTHSHSGDTGDYMTATDVCTLMLYGKYTGWDSHNVISKKYLNTWKCENNELEVISMKTLHKIHKKEEKQAKKDKRKVTKRGYQHKS